MKKFSIFNIAAALCLSASVFAANATSLLDVQHKWAEINYSDSKDKAEQFKALINDVKAMTKAEPENAEYFIWLGIVQSSTAGAEGGMGALKYAKAARKNLEKALHMDENALQGSAFTSLGVLYHKVPGWPIAFGSDDKAEQLLKKALKVNPDGIDPNYFYAEFLYDDGKYESALEYADKGLQAQARPDRPKADEGRMMELAALKEKIEKKIH